MPKYLLKEAERKDANEITPVELDEALETDLCLLWDMAADKDVAFCLIKHDIVALTKWTIDESLAPRPRVIIIQIYNNCHSE
jgi:hypothetical protein